MRQRLFLIFATLNQIAFSQSWVWDEIAQDAKESEPITFFHIILLAVVSASIWLGFRTFKYLKSLQFDKYKKIRKLIISICTAITVLIPIVVLTYFDIKRDRLQSEAIKSLNNIIHNAESYIEINDKSYYNFEEIEPRDHLVPNNLISKSIVYTTQLAYYGATPYNNIYHCYNINTFNGISVIFAGYARNLGLSSEKQPALFHGYIKPFRIRYYTPHTTNLEWDLRNVLPNFIQSVIWNHGAHQSNDITRDFFRRPLNEYYEINHLSSGEEMWTNHKLYYDTEYATERSYEYKTVNYGNFDITYCISQLYKLGVCEKQISGNIFGIKIFGDIHLVKRNKALTKYCTIWLVILCGIAMIIIKGNPSNIPHKDKLHRQF